MRRDIVVLRLLQNDFGTSASLADLLKYFRVGVDLILVLLHPSPGQLQQQPLPQDVERVDDRELGPVAPLGQRARRLQFVQL